EAVTNGLLSGAIDAIATDHAPHPGSEKMQEFERCPFGIIGLETALPLALERLFHAGKLSLSRFVALFTQNPARILALPKGSLAIGSDADVTIFSLDHKWTYDVTMSPSKSSNTPFHGRALTGGPLATIVNGRVVWRSDGF
ncbi:MAG: amidohydrolase family protein, partial [Bryobacteraceae bacterium]